MIVTFADLLFKIKNEFKQEAKLWLGEVLSPDGFPSVHCRIEHKDELMKGFLL